jgi:hypothetical protein
MAAQPNKIQSGSTPTPTENEGGTSATQSTSDSSGGGLTTPEGILMLMAAGILDGLGVVLSLVSWLGIDDYGILDILGAVIFGTWLFFRNGFGSLGRSTMKFLTAFGIELVPILGSVSPSWIVFVWKELKSK